MNRIEKKNYDRKPEGETQEVKEVMESGTELQLTNCTALNLRKKPIKKDKALFVIDEYCSIELVSEMGSDWYKVKVGSDLDKKTEYVGYVMSEYVEKVE